MLSGKGHLEKSEAWDIGSEISCTCTDFIISDTYIHLQKAQQVHYNDRASNYMQPSIITAVWGGRIIPALMAKERASTLSPILRTVSGDGPTNITPASEQAWAKSARSDRKP